MRSTVFSLRTYVSVIALSLVAAGTTANADTWLAVQDDGTTATIGAADARSPWISVQEHGPMGMQVTVNFRHLSLGQEDLDGETFTNVGGMRAPRRNDIGQPSLPVVRRLFGVPIGTRVEFKVQEGDATIIDLAAHGFQQPVAPLQVPPSIDRESLKETVRKGEAGQLAAYFSDSLLMDNATYGHDAFGPAAPVVIKEAGTARGLQLYVLEARPVAYNPVRGQIAVWPRMAVDVAFANWDASLVRPARWLNRVLLNPVPGRGQRDGELGILQIVTAPSFENSAPLNEYIAAKTADGYTVNVWAPEVGDVTTDMKTYLRALWGTADEPSYILLVGDCYSSYVLDNSLPVTGGSGPENAWGDIPFACLEGGDDWFPDVPIGRLTAREISELQAIVDKILYVQSGEFADPSYTQRAAFVCGSDTYSGGLEMHEELISTYYEPAGITPLRIYGSEGGTTEDISDALNTGVFMANFFGHAGGFQAWGDPPFYFSDIEALTNENLYPFLVTFSCSPAVFWYTSSEASPGFLEKWLLEPDKGAASGYGTTLQLDPYTWETWQDLYRFLIRSIYQDGMTEIGDASLSAAAYLVGYYGPEDPAAHDHTESFNIIGDPTLSLPARPAHNYLIIAPPAYANTTVLAGFIAHKENMGFNVTLYEVPSGTTNSAIKTYIQSLWGTNDSPDYILLVGDTSGQTSTSNTIPHFVGGGDKHADTDWPYGCMDQGDDWYPDIPVGRFSIANEDQLGNIIDKTVVVESGVYPNPDYVRRGAFLANPSTQGQAEPTHDWVIENYFDPNDYEGVRLYSAHGADTQDVKNAINEGALFALYFGHSSSSGWWDPSFGSGDINSLSNQGLYGIAFGWSCNTARYTNGECFGETWIRAENKGAAAYISASNYIYWGSVEAWRPSVVLEKSFFAAMFEDNLWNVGPAWMQGLYRFLADYGGWDGDPAHQPTENEDVCRNFFEEFVILGDPSLKLPQPNRFTLETILDTQEACLPEDVQVNYMLDIGVVGGFSDTVHLSVQDAPVGATVSFDVNDSAPPFSSMLVVGDLDNVAPGSYQLTVVGTAGEMQHTLPLYLGISNQHPGTVTLVSPENGAENTGRQPLLAWQAATAAESYDVELSSDPSFNTIVYSASVQNTSEQVEVMLGSATTYWWHVRAVNGCGDGGWSDSFSFTTVDQMDYYTEEFGSGFDLDGYTLELRVDGSGSFYSACLDVAEALPTDPSGGNTISLNDDSSSLISVPAGNSVYLYGTAYSDYYVGSNGFITFGQGDTTYNESLQQHFSIPRISALFDDFNPASGGTVSWKAEADHVAVTWLEVPEYGTSNDNTFQIEMFYNGDIHITWLGMAANDGITGLSQGNGIPDDFIESDLSSSPVCSEPPTGACCQGTKCTVISEYECLVAGGDYQGDGTDCDPSPCIDYDSSCLIISEVVQGRESGDCPRFIEITNTGYTDFPFFEGGIIVQTGGDDDLYVDIDLTGEVIEAGQSYVIVSNVNGQCTGAFDAIFGMSADFYTQVPFGFGTERFIITDTNDATNILDIYGRMGVDGGGQEWEFTDGYSFRLPEWCGGMGDHFAPAEWMFGGVGSLDGPNPTQLLLTYTTPGVHAYDTTCSAHVLGDIDGDFDVDLDDFVYVGYCLTGPDTPYPQGCEDADLDHDGDVDLMDYTWFQEFMGN